MRLPWAEIGQDEFEQICFELAGRLLFERRTFVKYKTGDTLKRDIECYRESDILPGVTYPEKWLVCPIAYTGTVLNINDIEPLKNWADEPDHEIDYLLVMSPNPLAKRADEWIHRFNRFPIKKYKIKSLSHVELEQLVATDRSLLERYFQGFEPAPPSEEEFSEVVEVITRRLINFRSDLAIIDIGLVLLFSLPEDEQEKIIRKIATVWSSSNFESLKRWNAGWVVVRLAKLMPALVPVDIVEKVALDRDEAPQIRALASHTYAWLAETNPSVVKAEILGELSNPDNDYFVSTPAARALSTLMSHDTDALSVIFSLARDVEAQKRLLAANIFLTIAEENPVFVSPSVVELLESDADERVREKGALLRMKLESFWEAPIRKEFELAVLEFQNRNYQRAYSLFSRIAARNDLRIGHDARLWGAYSLYMAKDFAFALKEFERYGSIKKEYELTSLWWQALCLEKMGKARDALPLIEAVARRVSEPDGELRIAPDRWVSGDELQALAFGRLRELKDKCKSIS